jgi:hypothetical protein
MEVVEILPSNQWPPHPSWTNGNRKWFDPPMEFTIRILMLNETLKRFRPLIKIGWYMTYGIEWLILFPTLDILMGFLNSIIVNFVRLTLTS